MKNIITRTKMDISAAVEYGVDMVESGNKKFFMDTQFGVIPVEVFLAKPQLEDIGARKYRFAKKTKFVIDNYDSDLKWHVSINRVPAQPVILTRIQLIRSLIFIVYSELFGLSPSKTNMAVLTDAYMRAYRNPDMYDDSNDFISAFTKMHCMAGSLIKSDSYDTLFQSVTKIVAESVETCNYNKSNFLKGFDKAGYSDDCFGDCFYDMIVAMMIHYNFICDKDVYEETLAGLNGDITAISLIRRMKK